MAELLLGKPIFPGLPLSSFPLSIVVRPTTLKQTFGYRVFEPNSYPVILLKQLPKQGHCFTWLFFLLQSVSMHYVDDMLSMAEEITRHKHRHAHKLLGPLDHPLALTLDPIAQN